MRRNGEIQGFALPTVLIASVVMLIVLAVSVTSVVAVRTALKTQYYEQLARVAGEAGVAYAKACLAKSGNVPTWTDAKPLTPSSDCTGTQRLEPAVQVLVVAGGGGGGNNHAGGGGGGGVIYNESISVAVQSYPVVVGGGGAGGSGSAGAAGINGANSTAFGLTAIGGGGGGGRIANNSVSLAKVGGSGGGGAGTLNGSTGFAGPGAAGTASQGSAGGNGTSDATAGNGGGGGGAGSVGANAVGTGAGVGTSGGGGTGYASTISGAVVYYGGGGAGGRWSAGTVGLPGITGGGMGGNNDAVAGGPGGVNTGGGGGGGGGGSANGGAGGSGIVIIKYPANGSITATGGTKTDDGVNVIHRFTSGTVNFQVTAATTSSCPLDDRCTVAIQGNARSSFSVGLPTVDTSGKALAIPNNGYVELLRTSNGSVWRTYRQPSVQAAVVPDLCSGGNTASATGWANAVRTTSQSPVPGSSAAETISLSTSPLVAGKVYYRKDFSVQTAGTYNLSYTGIGAQDSIQVYLNGVPQSSGDGSAVRSASLSLSPGCYNLTLVVDNVTLASRESGITASLRFNEGAPLVVSDTTWRVAAGAPVHFSNSDFDENASMWQLVAASDSTLVTVPSWTATEDTWNRLIAPNHSGCWATCPAASYAYLRDYKDVVVTSNTEVRLSVVCDDSCNVYMDGSLVQSSSPWNSTATQNITLTPGSHRFAIRLQNGGSAANGSRAGFSVKRVSDNIILTRTDAKWKAANTWTTAALDPYSYEASFVPSPAPVLATAKVDALVVGGGGGGGSSNGGAGGGGGGGVQFFKDIPISIGANAVVVGAGGTGSATATNGGNSQFLNSSYLSNGGGSGSSRSSTANPAGSGGSGGGGSSGRSGDLEANRTGGLGMFGQGGSGGLAGPRGSSAGTGGGGGGSGGDGLGGTTTGGSGGAGGPGYITYITGTRLAVGGGGGGGGAALAAYGAATDGASATGSANASANTGGGGAGGGTARSGGSGIVIIRYKTGTLTATGGTITTWNGYTIHTFTATGAFNVTALTP